MRIIAGELGGRLFDSPHSARTHPMSDRMRGALFNVLGGIGGLRVLDPFAGSGALSFEAVSRGAEQAVAIDTDLAAQKTIARNIATLGLKPRVKLIRTSAGAWLRTDAGAYFDLILCDPPYNDPQPALLARLAARLRPDGLYVLSWPGQQEPPGLPGLRPVLARRYGDAQLVFYRREDS